MAMSSQGIEMLKSFEMSDGILKDWGIGAYDEQDHLIGIYPHYVFKPDADRNWISDGGITIGYGHWISKGLYSGNDDDKELIDKYALNAPILPINIPRNGKTYVVPGSSYVPLNETEELFKADIKKSEEAVNDFLYENQIKLNQNQFDVLVSFTHQYGAGWWELEGKKLPELIKRGNGNYDDGEVRYIFLEHNDKERRKKEAEIFINGY